jgi:hypothetical protein
MSEHLKFVGVRPADSAGSGQEHYTSIYQSVDAEKQRERGEDETWPEENHEPE